MEHGEAAELIAAAVVGPGKLGSIDTDPSPSGIELRRHLETCPDCRSELQAWRLVDQALAEATPDDLRAPAEARERILDTVVTSGVLREPAAVRPSTVAMSEADAAAAGRVSRVLTRFTLGRSLLAAAAVVVLLATGALLGGPLGSAPSHDEASAELANALTYAADVLGQPGHVVASLQTPVGTPGGVVALSPDSGELVVFSGALTPPSGGQRYVCYLERDGARTAVGSMWFVGTSAYWTGEVAAAIDAGRPGDRFIVQLEGSSAAALTGTF